MKKLKIKRYYIRVFLRPLRVLRLSFVYFYSRIILFLALRGIKLPGLDGIKKRMPPSALGAYERRVLIYDIKAERYSFRLGPIWVRKLFDKLIYIFSRNRFWLSFVLKTLIAFFIIAIPIAIFIIIRGVLPVSERVSYIPITTKLSENSNTRTDWLYTEPPFLNNNNSFNYIDPANSRGVSITPVLAPNSPLGLIHFGIGYYPIKMNLLRGFLVSESSSLNITRNRNVTIEVENGNKLRIQYYLFPTKNNIQYQCKIQLNDQTGKLITSITKMTPPKHKPRSPGSLSTAWNERFVPNTMPDFGEIGEFVINLKSPPQKIIATSINSSQNKENINLSSVSVEPEYINSFKVNSSNIKGNDVTDDNCIFALGDFSFERTVIQPPKRRGIIFILVDTLRVNSAYDNDLMPNLNNFAKNNGIKFLEHRAQGNMTVPSVIPLMTSRYSREIGPIAFTYAVNSAIKKSFYNQEYPLLASYMQSLGYRVGGIGWLSLFSEAMEGGIDLGFHNAIISESPQYEVRQITEYVGSWLETYGDAPFFLYVHYNTTHGPYKPPLEEIDLKKFFLKPFGLNQKKQLYNGTARAWDNEFKNILLKLKELGIENDVDIIITSDHGAQLDVQPWYYLSGVNQNIDGGYADKGKTLLDEEVRVPLIMHLANNNKINGTTVTIPTAHIDLFPTLYRLAGGTLVNQKWRGINLLPALEEDGKASFSDLLKDRKSIYFDGHKYAGILYWGENFSKNPMKYVRQLAPDDLTLYLTHNPWSEKIKWYQPEIFSSINFNDHTEKLLPIIQSDELKLLRSAYFEASPSNKLIRFTSKYNGQFKVTVKLNNKKKGNEPSISLLPAGIKYTEKKVNNFIDYNFSGNIYKDEAVWLNLGDSSVLSVEFEDDIVPIICPNGNKIQNKLIANVLQSNTCSFFPPPDGVVEANYSAKDKVVVIQKTLSSEQVQQIEGTGAGAALKNALREWGYAK